MAISTYPSGTLNIANVQKSIYDWIKSRVNGLIPDEQILWRNQSEPLPPRPCVTMRITSGPTRVGFSDSVTFRGESPTGTDFMVSGHRTMVVSIQVFGSTKVKSVKAYQLAVDLNSSLSLPTVLEGLSAAGLSVQSQGEPNNMTALEETEYEERAQFDITFGLAQNVVDDPGVIEHVGTINKTINE